MWRSRQIPGLRGETLRLRSGQALGTRHSNATNNMRIIAGKFRSRQLTAPRGWKTRPTSDRLRETIFNVLTPWIEGAVFADLFAGTGAVGIEALSRGARRAYFAEIAKPPLTALRDNLEKLGIGSGMDSEALVEPAGTLALLRRLLKQGIQLDVVFLDPPYSDREAYQTTLQFLAEQPVLSVEAIVVVEHARRLPLVKIDENLQPFRSIEQGEAAVTFFRCNTSKLKMSG